MTSLLKYDAACRALAEAKAIDEVKDIHDKAEAVRCYARMANDIGLEISAAEIRVRAERRLGEMLITAKETGQFGQGKPKRQDAGQLPRIKLEDVGIDRTLSSRAQKVGGIAEQAFEAMVGRMREQMQERGRRVSTDLLKTNDKKARRAEREADLGTSQRALPQAKFGVILADPEWRFEPYSRDTGMDRAADNHYPTSNLDQILDRPVWKIAADDCVLFLWATVPMLPQALSVMQSWGFDYKSHVIWSKLRATRKQAVGTGYWFRNCHELLLVGVKGHPPAPAIGDQWLSLMESEIAEHSRKPEVFLEMIEQYFPTLPKIELNRRGPERPGWKAWGNEAESIDPETGEVLEVTT